MLRAFVDKPGVSLTCTPACQRVKQPAGLGGYAVLSRFDGLNEDEWVYTRLKAQYPAAVREFEIGFNAEAENVPRTYFGSLTVHLLQTH